MIDMRDVIVGEKLMALEYVQVRWDQAPAPRSQIDNVSMAVRVTFSSGRVLEVGWATGYRFEQLSLRLDSSIPLQEIYRLLDVSEKWRCLLDRKCVAFETYMQGCEDGSVRPWAMRLTLTGGGELVVALGEWDRDQVVYSADNLVITSNPSLLRYYRPLAAISLPWTDPYE